MIPTPIDVIGVAPVILVVRIELYIYGRGVDIHNAVIIRGRCRDLNGVAIKPRRTARLEGDCNVGEQRSSAACGPNSLEYTHCGSLGSGSNNR
jgi:hypothetical protein